MDTEKLSEETSKRIADFNSELKVLLEKYGLGIAAKPFIFEVPKKDEITEQ